MLDKIIGSKKEIGEQEYPEEFTPNEKEIAKSGDSDIKEFLAKKELRKEGKKDGKKNASQNDLLEEEEQGPETIPEGLEERPETEAPVEPAREPDITHTTSFNVKVNSKNIETAKRILVDNAEKGFTIAFQAGIYVDTSNVENVKRALKYLVENNYKIVIATEQTQEISNDK